MTAACGHPGIDPTMFDFDRPRSEHERAAAVCERCGIRDACVLEAVERKASGVFGGALYVDGKRVRKLRTPVEMAESTHRAVVLAAEGRSGRALLGTF